MSNPLTRRELFYGVERPVLAAVALLPVIIVLRAFAPRHFIVRVHPVDKGIDNLRLTAELSDEGPEARVQVLVYLVVDDLAGCRLCRRLRRRARRPLGSGRLGRVILDCPNQVVDRDLCVLVVDRYRKNAVAEGEAGEGGGPFVPLRIEARVVLFQDAYGSFDAGARHADRLDGVPEILRLDEVELHLGVEHEDKREKHRYHEQHGNEYEAFVIALLHSGLPPPPRTACWSP